MKEVMLKIELQKGVETKTGIIFGEIPERTIMLDNGVKYSIDIV